MSDKNNSGLEVGRSDSLPSALPVAARLLNWTGPKNLAVFPPSGVVARTFDELPRDSAKSTWSEGDGLVRLSDAEAALAELVAVLERYSADGHLQSYEDRERFRKAARAALLKAEGAK